uniref:ATP-dependent Clp protease proteolytic subunit-related protein 3, chloroplastic isoform X2 n=1 Tax=Erigeron canadensis TaxID=72917 RepID=UPI001CB9931A|nr:ATP-dependent Clp protease proteolytic subunit-related protein 3, chloroplastic isoform X2 [Erigeron canadensis]
MSTTTLIPCCSSANIISSSRQTTTTIRVCSVLGRNKNAPLLPPLNPKDPFLSKLASIAAVTPPERLLNRPADLDTPPYLDLFDSPTLMATPASVERSVSYNEHRPRRPPPDLPSLLLHGRIVYLGMPVGMETEGFAIYDAMMQLKNEIHTVGVGAAIGHACLLLAAGAKGKRLMMPHAKAMIQQPRVPSSGLMTGSDVIIRAKEVIINKDTLVGLLAKHTENSVETVTQVMRRPFYMDSTTAKEFGVIDKILWRGQEKIMADAAPPEAWDKNAGIKSLDAM